MMKPLLKKYAEYRLPQAIVNYDLAKVQECLDRGARHIDYLLMQNADFGNGSQQIPAGKFSDPVELAKKVGFTEGVNLIERYTKNTRDVSNPAPRA